MSTPRNRRGPFASAKVNGLKPYVITTWTESGRSGRIEWAPSIGEAKARWGRAPGTHVAVYRARTVDIEEYA